MLGPLFRYELTRLARRGLQPKLRAAFVGVLLVVILLAYLAAFPGIGPIQLLTRIDEPLSIEAASRFGERFSVGFLMAQAVIVVLVTPAITAGAIGEEKERGSLDLLLTTSLSPWEIVGGKFAARLVFLGSLLLTGLPVVTLMVFMGGVDVMQLIAGYIIALCTVCSLGAFTIYLTVVCATTGQALIRAYVWGLAFTVVGFICACCRAPAFLSPVGITWVMLSGWEGILWGRSPAQLPDLVLIYFWVHLSIALLATLTAVSILREASRNAGSMDRFAEVEATPGIGITIGSRTWTVPEVRDHDPLIWKERYFTGTNPHWISPELFVIGAFLGPVVVFIFSLAWVARGGAAWLAGLATMAGLVALILAGLRACGSVVGERQRGTLESLLVLPIDRRDILDAKARGALFAGFIAGGIAWGIVLLGVIRTSLALPAAIAMVLVLAGWAVGVVGFGMWLSVRCATRERAVGWFLGVGLVVCVLPPLVGQVIADAMPNALFPYAMITGFSPPVGLWGSVAPNWKWTDVTGWAGMLGSLCAAGVIATMGLLFRNRAVRAFEA